LVVIALGVAIPPPAAARPPIRTAFFNRYANAVGSQLDNLPSKPGHCGVCHFDFNGGGTRNPYGVAIQARLDAGRTNAQAIADVESFESDGDGYTNLVEITDETTYSNTPTFPGLTQANKGSTLNVPLAEIEPYLTPMTGPDTTPPAVTVSSPNGGEVLTAETTHVITFTATDANGIARINIFLSDDGVLYKPIAKNLAPTAFFSWFVPNLPGAASRIRVEAIDNAGNSGWDVSNAAFTINRPARGIVPSTLRDVALPGTQPFEGAVLEDPSSTCAACHGGYDSAHEPWFVWKGSMMAQAMRDPLFIACVAVAEQDVPSVGDLCLRCHTPGGWQEGRSVDTDGGLLTAKDRQGVQCDFCHRMVDYDYVPGVSPPADTTVLAGVNPKPLTYGNGQFINDPAAVRRGPYASTVAPHAFLASPYHRSADLCGTCHDVSSPAYTWASGDDYVLGPFDQQHPDMNLRHMMPIERTFSEWTQSAYATTGVYAPQFAGNKADGIVSTCQDCHMADVNAKGCNDPNAPTRADLGLHDLTGGNTFIPDILATFYPSEVDAPSLQAGKARATAMLQKAATLGATPAPFGVTVRVTNETGHKLPSGYPEGRRIWINVVGITAAGQKVFESGVYDPATAQLADDDQLKVYEIHLGLSPAIAGAVGFPAGPSFHFVLNDTVYFDNRIPPRGFTNAAFAAVQAKPVGVSYADGRYWDDTSYNLPASADSAIVTLYYQTLSREYVEFLRDENVTNTKGADLYNAWAANGKSAPVAMAQVRVPLDVVTAVDGPPPAAALTYSLAAGQPNPFRYTTALTYAHPAKERVRLAVYDLTGRHVRTLVDGVQAPSRETVAWDGTDERGASLASGIYIIRYQAGERVLTKRATLIR
jgi:hypothetical protein